MKLCMCYLDIGFFVKTKLSCSLKIEWIDIRFFLGVLTDFESTYYWTCRVDFWVCISSAKSLSSNLWQIWRDYESHNSTVQRGNSLESLEESSFSDETNPLAIAIEIFHVYAVKPTASFTNRIWFVLLQIWDGSESLSPLEEISKNLHLQCF